MVRKMLIVTALSLIALTSSLSVGSAEARWWGRGGWGCCGWHAGWGWGGGWRGYGWRGGYWGPGVRVGYHWGWGWHGGWGWRRW
jgi:hypothetical protein